MPISINGTTGISGVDGSAGTPALQGSDTNTGIAFGSDVILGTTGGTERFRCDSSGRLLVGTSSSPSVGSHSQYGKIFSAGNTNVSTGAGVISIARGLASSSGFSANDHLGSLCYTDSVGAEFARIEAFADAASGSSDYPGRLVFSTTRDGQSSPSEAARILNDQTILVGKTTNDTTSTGITLFGANNASAGQVLAVSSVDAGIFYRKTSSVGDGVILTKSNIGGTNTLVGAGFANGTFGTVSDATKKKNIETARNYLDDIKNIRVVKYNWNTDEDGTPKELGWIAQEVEQVFPGMVAELEGTKLLKKEVFVPMLMKCIQEQQAIIEGLEARLTALESA